MCSVNKSLFVPICLRHAFSLFCGLYYTQWLRENYSISAFKSVWKFQVFVFLCQRKFITLSKSNYYGFKKYLAGEHDKRQPFVEESILIFTMTVEGETCSIILKASAPAVSSTAVII